MNTTDLSKAVTFLRHKKFSGKIWNCGKFFGNFKVGLSALLQVDEVACEWYLLVCIRSNKEVGQ